MLPVPYGDAGAPDCSGGDGRGEESLPFAIAAEDSAGL